MAILRKRLDSSIEDKIVTGMILSKKFLDATYTLFSPDYMLNQYAQTICKWAKDYYEVYEQAPKKHIQDIFDIEKSNLKKEEADIIEALLTRLSKDYGDNQPFNDDYFLDKALQYFKRRELEITSRNIQKLLEIGRMDEAEAELSKYRKIEKATSGWCDPFAHESIVEVFSEEGSDGIMSLPGQLGEMIGEIERGWLVGILGPFKRGKTWWLQEMAVIALCHRLKVLFISLEMKKKKMNHRIYKRIVGAGDKETHFVYPCFDCRLNQSGDCLNPARLTVNRIPLLDGEGNLPEYNPESEYRPCTLCRPNDPFEFATWFEQHDRPNFSFKEVASSIKGFQLMYGDNNFRTKSYPRFSASVEEIKRDIDMLEQVEGFVPDIIIVDYADILKPGGKGNRTGELDDIWKELGGLAAERNCIVFTGSQGVRGSLYKKLLRQDDLAEWIGKLGHVDLLFALNQTGAEKKMGVMRINLLAHRHRDFHEDEIAVVLQQLDVGQIELDTLRTWYQEQ